MMNKLFVIIVVVIILLLQNCSKDELVLNEEYITVSDFREYFRVKCSEADIYEGKEIKIRGHINYPYFNSYFSSFKLVDIRNGREAHIYIGDYIVKPDTNLANSIINKILNSNPTDICFIKGIIHQCDECDGVHLLGFGGCKTVPVVILNNPDNIFFGNTKY